jgi:hypothetical protein
MPRAFLEKLKLEGPEPLSPVVSGLYKNLTQRFARMGS